jgi:hypothetical protein
MLAFAVTSTGAALPTPSQLAELRHFHGPWRFRTADHRTWHLQVRHLRGTEATSTGRLRGPHKGYVEIHEFDGGFLLNLIGSDGLCWSFQFIRPDVDHVVGTVEACDAPLSNGVPFKGRRGR